MNATDESTPAKLASCNFHVFIMHANARVIALYKRQSRFYWTHILIEILLTMIDFKSIQNHKCCGKIIKLNEC